MNFISSSEFIILRYIKGKINRENSIGETKTGKPLSRRELYSITNVDIDIVRIRYNSYDLIIDLLNGNLSSMHNRGRVGCMLDVQ